MLDHVSIGIRDIAASKAFYDAALAPLGYKCLSEGAAMLGYGRGAVALWIGQAEQPVIADAKSGLHLCFAAPSRAGVAEFHAAALAAGGHDNGAPGIRAEYGPDYYAAFVIDPDGYRIEAYCGRTPAQQPSVPEPVRKLEPDRKLLWKADELTAHQYAVSQRLNPNSYLLRTGLSRLAGLKRAHVTLGRIPPGKDSFAYHSHMIEEEWVYIISGSGVADIDGGHYEVGPGDFMGFPAPGTAHLLRNPSAIELVYLMGGEGLPLDVLDYPELGRRFVLVYGGGPPDFYELGEASQPFGRADHA